MPNIMLTYRCNLNCPYCFANEFVNKKNVDISGENFDRALQFIINSGIDDVGLIGGEPLLHPQFGLFMEKMIENSKIRQIHIYTNGLLIDKYIPLLVNPKVTMLVNCNQPEQIGEKNYQRLVDNLDVLLGEYHMKRRLNLGINLFDKGMDCTYMLELLKRYRLHKLRISIVVPDFSKEAQTDVLQYFRDWKPFLLKFLHDMDSVQAVPYYDCNKPPYCIWSDEEKAWLEKYIAKYPVGETNLIGQHSFCHPVIDILPDLQAVRCFGLSDFEKADIGDFRSIDDIVQYFIGIIDCGAYRIAAEPVCRSCMSRKVGSCTAGCMGFKLNRIRHFNQLAESV